MEKRTSRNFTSPLFSIVGYPDDLGIKNVKGRLGAKAGPERFLEFFQKLNGVSPIQSRLKDTLVVSMGSDLTQNHEAARKGTLGVLKGLQNRSELLLAIGGGHDYAYPWLCAIRERAGKKRVGCLNLDAHFDLRSCSEQMTSGSPFRKLIEEQVLDPKRFVEFGIQSHCNSPELWDYAKSKKIKVVPFSELRAGKAVTRFKAELKKLAKICDEVVISFDLDSASFAYAPGVSAPQAEGFTGSEIFQMLEIAGADKKVTSLGIFELSPPLDIQDLTSRFAAQSAWHFVAARFKK